jgi:iron complex outermembrane receptor protein
MTNVRDSYRAGIEISALLRLSQFMNWNLNTTFSRNKILDFTEYYTDYNTSDWSSRYLSRNLGKVDIAFSPAVTGSSDLIFIISEALKIHLLSKFVGKQYFDNTMSSDRRLDPYFVNNVRFDLDPPARKIKGVQIQLLLNNILNSKYENNAYGGNWFEDGVEKTWAYYFPQAGFNFLAKLNVKF